MAKQLVSLRKSMESLDYLDERFRQALCCYLAALAGVEEHVFAPFAAKIAGPRPSLEVEAARLRANPDSQAFEQARSRLDALLGETAGRIQQHLAGTVDLNEILELLTVTARSLDGSCVKKQDEFRGVAEELNAASKLDDVEELRIRIHSQVRHLNDLVLQMRDENRRMVEELGQEMDRYQRRLCDAVESANRDTLTGLSNRRALHLRLNEFIATGTPFCLLLIDLNRFKLINDVHGHLAGDELLRTFALRLCNHLRPDDTAARWGGDEFVVALPCSLADAMTRASFLEQNLRGQYSIRCGANPLWIRLGLSIGVAEYRPGETAEQVMARADESLYARKNG